MMPNLAPEQLLQSWHDLERVGDAELTDYFELPNYDLRIPEFEQLPQPQRESVEDLMRAVRQEDGGKVARWLIQVIGQYLGEQLLAAREGDHQGFTELAQDPDWCSTAGCLGVEFYTPAAQRIWHPKENKSGDDGDDDQRAVTASKDAAGQNKMVSPVREGRQ